ncbi:NAD-dependent epimerase/dehydratase family protein [Algoriphagus vanfongensis]|uniref:NAD-dependent epimerase/dehydratase family protein n=1 Tax=Algoriphagus vanfongensis TaxID=426371 RepID=UPI0003FA41A2|nr:NAD-dependent epimerase/dehydratase family protein [Algoriphagus vanfongensis]
MKILLTGAGGFLGSYLQKELIGELSTLGRRSSSSIICSLDKEVPVLSEYDLIVHNAGWAHRIPKSPEQEKRFFEVNFVGTQNLVTGIDNSGKYPQAMVFISTVAVYGVDTGELIAESCEPNPKTPYAKSKYKAEQLLQDWASQHGVNLSILRLPLIAGGNQTPGNLGAMIKAIQRGYYFRIGKGSAKKSLVLAEDVACLIPTLINTTGIFNLTDGVNPSLAELEEYLGSFYGKRVRSIAPWILRVATWFGDLIPGFPINSYRMGKLGDSLTFDDAKARRELSWDPRPVIGNLDLR